MANWNAIAFTPEMDEIIERRYPSGGTRSVHRALPHIPADSIRRRANTLGVAYGILRDRVRISEVAKDANVTTRVVSLAAHRDRVAVHTGAPRAPLTYVPAKWARAYIERTLAAQELDDLIGHWYDLYTAGRVVGTHWKTLSRWTNTLPGRSSSAAHAAWYATVRTDRTSGKTQGVRLYNPHDVEAFARWYRDRSEP